MKNAETPVLKLVLFGAISSLGSALMAEFLRRQHEVIAILDDLNALTPRPGLRTKIGNLSDAEQVSQSVAGGSAVVCLLEPLDAVSATQHLIDGLQRMGVARLIVVSDFDKPSLEIIDLLTHSTLNWTLINNPKDVLGLSIEHFNQISETLEPGLAEPLVHLSRVAAGIADELDLNLHVRELVNFVF
ncbi:MAG: NADH-flavin reductase [Pseudomonas sp.]|nr:NADH-flavin reductase [Pseudomonas sp.]